MINCLIRSSNGACRGGFSHERC